MTEGQQIVRGVYADLACGDDGGRNAPARPGR